MTGSNWACFDFKACFWFLFVFLAFVQLGYTQGGYFVAKGKILEKGTDSPLNEAYICIPSTGYGTAPNLDGDFIFQFPNLSLDSTVIVSLIGYKSETFLASDLKKENNTIYLEKQELFNGNYGLSDVNIMLRAALDSIHVNYSTSPYYQNGFYQEIISLPTIGPIKVNEGVLRVERFPNLKDKPEKVKLLRGRRIEWRGQTQKIEGWGFQNGSDLVCRSLENSLPDFLERKKLNDYDFRLDSVMIKYEDLSLFIIHFTPRKSKLKGAKEGTIYLEPETKAIVRIEYRLTPNGLKDLIDSNAGPVKIRGKETSVVFQYRKFNKKWCLQESRVNFDINFEDKLDGKYKIDSHILMRYVAFENLNLIKSNIFPNEILLSTNNFAVSNSVNYEYWAPYNYLLSSDEAKNLSSFLTK
ncbi:hypothetical protein EGI22_03155 [Lacihabitans sp. LS3-19]|nr:hypothetical protein [Lacihabitans sp. LS3-19]